MTYKAMKFRIKDEAHSKETQKRLFEQGYLWAGESTARVIREDAPTLYTNNQGKITFASSDKSNLEYFLGADEPEYMLLEGHFFPASEQALSEEDAQIVDKPVKKHSHYHKDVSHLDSIDVYRVLSLFEVTDQALGHAIKKLLCAGKRGAKDVEKDVQEAIDTLVRRQEMRSEDLQQAVWKEDATIFPNIRFPDIKDV